MPFSIEAILIIAAVALVASVALSKVSDRFGVPVLLLFIGMGMLLGSDGPGGIYFDNAWVSQFLGTIALAYILFAGGIETDTASVRKVLRPSLSLATFGVLITALVTGVCARFALGVSWLEGLLIGSIVSSTDAAAVFAVLRSKNVGLKEPLRPLLELESGSNDPMAVFLTIGLIELIKIPDRSMWTLVPFFFQQMILGLLIGYAMARLFVYIVNRIRLDYEGLYPVLSLGWVLLTYGVTVALRGSGFLAVYIAGLMLSRLVFAHKRSLIRFHDGMGWLMQIAMFTTLGLLVFPTRLFAVAGPALLVSAALIVIARPISVFLGTVSMGLDVRQKLMISWVGLRGSVPIVLATFPLMAGLDQDHFIFNLVFFVVITSVLLQGTTIPLVARWLGVDAPLVRQRRYPIEFEGSAKMDMQLTDFIVPYGSGAAGRSILSLAFPRDCLITMVVRGEQYVMPTGDTVLEEGDVLLILTNSETLKTVNDIFRVANKEAAV